MSKNLQFFHTFGTASPIDPSLYHSFHSQYGSLLIAKGRYNKYNYVELCNDHLCLPKIVPANCLCYSDWIALVKLPLLVMYHFTMKYRVSYCVAAWLLNDKLIVEWVTGQKEASHQAMQDYKCTHVVSTCTIQSRSISTIRNLYCSDECFAEKLPTKLYLKVYYLSPFVTFRIMEAKSRYVAVCRPSFRNVFNGGQKWTCDIRRGAKPRAVCVSTQPFRGVWGHAPPDFFCHLYRLRSILVHFSDFFNHTCTWQFGPV